MNELRLIDPPSDGESGDPWSTWAPRPTLRPEFSRTGETLSVAGQGRRAVCGCWERLLPPLEAGKRYRIAVEFRTAGVRSPGESVWALLVRKVNGRRELPKEYLLQKVQGESGAGDGWTRLQCDFVSDGRSDLFLCLYLAWDPGEVVWRNAVIGEAPPKSARRIRAAAIAGEQPLGTPVEECLRYWTELVEQAASYGAELVCLPERINRQPELYAGGPFKGDLEYGRFVETLAALAARHRMFLCVGLHRPEGEFVYNTAVFIDDRGETLGVYRKTHPTIQESLFYGLTPGDAYPVFSTRLGRLAAMVCYDYHYPEVARILGLGGADVICLPNAGDGREGGMYWETVLRTRAIDSQVHIVSGVNGGRASIVSPSGALLASSGKHMPGIAVAELDLDETMRAWDLRPLKGVYDKVRRASSFGPLQRHIWDD